jgi:hypothetical protein
MRSRSLRAAITAVAWAAAIGFPAAQTTAPGIPAGTQLNPGRVTPGGGNFIVIGCVSRQGPEASAPFILEDSRPSPPARYRLEGDVNLLRMHVGHMLEIGGPIVPVSGAGAMPTLKVQSLTYISTTCLKLKGA